MTEIDLLDADRFQRLEHHEMFRKLREQGPVIWHEPTRWKRGFWSVVKHAEVQEASRDADRFSNERGGVNIRDIDELEGGSDSRGLLLTEMDPPRHTRFRMLVNKGFTPRMIRLLEEHFAHRSKLIVDAVVERGECDFVEDLAAELPLQAIAEIMGVPEEDRRLVFEWSNRMIGTDDPDYAANDGSSAAQELYAYVNQLAKERRADPRDDICTKLLGAEIDGDKLTEQEFDSFMLLLTVAGNETTRNTTSWGMWALMQHPEQYAALVDDLDGKLDRAIEEMLRWASQVYHFRRTATRDTSLGGVDIAEDDKVELWYISANRDEEVFDDPFRFDIERFPNEHVVFGGGGLHYCLGANLARLELRSIFREVLTRIHDMRVAGEVPILRSNFIGGIKHLPVAFTPSVRRAKVGV
ncbi:MAG: Cytochrome [Actinomycetia bacterium]|nr:Cytochrome [Actinomycetes bacterium]